ncbi:hypothetical protein GSI_10130 [Ganoderma sinense ZZ0214-1]|uniref:Uncharacterized protein n=1 Tax=Ganoderma sinense ZZ0214-1 TaxID=1077348 RepID=A0A2G8RZP4_9APHY|nr:hypothetical protein GSI_10130 [Ganoderma sinense ZZ0214-1]
MAKRSREVAHDSSDDEAPEAVSFGTSKKAAKGAQDALQQHHTAQKQKQKEKNRALDRALKDRSANTKGKDKAVVVGSGKQSKKAEATPSEDEGSDDDEAEEGMQGGPSREELEERMARAMMEAEDESGSEEDDEGFAGSGDDVGMDGEDEEISDEGDGSEGEDEDEDEELLEEEQSDGDEDGDEDEEMGFEDEDEDEDENVPSTNPSGVSRKDDYLPDHLFKSAFSHTGKKIVFDDDDDPLPAAEASPPRKRKRTKRASKDILLGSRTIRTLPKPNAVASSVVAKGLAPPRRVDKFVRTSLNLKGDVAKAKSKGWNRQPENGRLGRDHQPPVFGEDEVRGNRAEEELSEQRPFRILDLQAYMVSSQLNWSCTA